MLSVSSSSLLLTPINTSTEKLLGQLKGASKEKFIEDMKPQLVKLKQFNYGKQIQAIEKLILPSSYNMMPSSIAPHAPHAMSIDVISSTPTPALTDAQNSPRSTSIPSTSFSTTDEAIDVQSVEMNDKDRACPEVTISSI